MTGLDEKTCLCALNRALGYQPVLGHRLLEYFGTASAVLTQPRSILQDALGSHRDLADALGPEAVTWAEGELERVRDGGFRFIGIDEEDYPALLRECPDPPLGLYYNACTPPTTVFDLHPCIAVVGTRDLDAYGKEWCRKLVQTMAQAATPPAIISGLAFGADAVAHRTALEQGLGTVGVMATGIERIYPWQHTDLAAGIVRTPGCAVVTDYPMGSAPVALNFMRRNRIIAGLARATVVIESKTKGGSLITARYATEYNRDVYALPGKADDLRSQGCNFLIRQRMADIVTDPDDLVERLGLGRKARRPRKDDLETLLTRRYGPGSPLAALGLLVGRRRGISYEEICRETGWSWTEVAGKAAILESDGFLTTDLLQRCTIQVKNV